MAHYKVIQDIEAEDKLFGPLSLRQFIYASIALICAFIAFKFATAKWFLAFPFLPPIVFFGLLASPFSKVQPSEVWLLAKIRFFLKPQRRIWDQSGIKDLVTITVPKKIERILSKNFTQSEVQSRLQALSSTIDSRGWAVKNVNVNLFSQPSYILDQANSDRLIDGTTLSEEVTNFNIAPAEDIMDERNNPTAQHLDQMISASAQSHRQQAVATMQQSAQPSPPTANPDYWFMNQPDSPPDLPADYATFSNSPVVTPGAAAISADDTGADDQALLQKLHADLNQAQMAPVNSHLRVVQPLSQQKATSQTAQQDQHGDDAAASGASLPEKAVPQEQTNMPDDETILHKSSILNLAHDNDKTVATLARQAEKDRPKGLPEDEVVISLR